MKDSFILYTKYGKQIARLTMEERGVLFTAILAHQMGEPLPEMDAFTSVAYDFIAADMDENERKYEERCEKNRENGRLGGRPKKPKETEWFLEKRTPPKKADNDNDNDYKEKDNTSYYPKRKELADCEALILNDGTEWKPTSEEYSEYERLYPAVNVRQEFANMRGWCSGNPTKRKTRNGIKRFVTSWLSRAQNRPQQTTTTKWSAKVESRDYDMDDLELKLMSAQKG